MFIVFYTCNIDVNTFFYFLRSFAHLGQERTVQEGHRSVQNAVPVTGVE